MPTTYREGRVIQHDGANPPPEPDLNAPSAEPTPEQPTEAEPEGDEPDADEKPAKKKAPAAHPAKKGHR